MVLALFATLLTGVKVVFLSILQVNETLRSSHSFPTHFGRQLLLSADDGICPNESHHFSPISQKHS